jgi:putative endopeptidase
MISGIDIHGLDHGIRPQDDFYRHVNGKWLAATDIPADHGSYGAFQALRAQVQSQLRELIEDLPIDGGRVDDDEQKMARLYAAFMDEGALQPLGLNPLQGELTRISALEHHSQIPALITHLNRIGVRAPLALRVVQDARDPSRNTLELQQDGLGLPDRDYYLRDDAECPRIRAQYLEHIERMLALTGDADAGRQARAVAALETALAAAQCSRSDERDPLKAYNRIAIGRLESLAPAGNWRAGLAAAGLAGSTGLLILRQPRYFSALDRLLRQTPLADWKTYLRWRLLTAFAPYLSRGYVDEHFAFNGTALRGIPRNRDRWRRGVELVDSLMGDALGRLYVSAHFPAQFKARIDQLMAHLLAAFRDRLDALDWMGPDTRRRAQFKLSKLRVKIGYPPAWRDYDAVHISRGDLVGSVINARRCEFNRNLRKLDHAPDRSEWALTPQTVNASYNPQLNDVTFPAAILQPPFFNPRADDAVNFGAIGAIIAHEISHGFDDQGSKYDGDGSLLDAPGWFCAGDLERFRERTGELVTQYAQFAPLPGYRTNGELTLGENIADNSGLAVAYRAYRLSLAGKASPMIDGLSGDQRFFIGWAQAWRSKTRDRQRITSLASDPHAADEIRGIVPAMNQTPFHAAFSIGTGDRMYLPPDSRISVW